MPTNRCCCERKTRSTLPEKQRKTAGTMMASTVCGRHLFKGRLHFFNRKRRLQRKLLTVHENAGGAPELVFHGFHGIIGKDTQADAVPHFVLDLFGHTYGRFAAPSAGISAMKHHHINHLIFLLSIQCSLTAVPGRFSFVPRPELSSGLCPVNVTSTFAWIKTWIIY